MNFRELLRAGQAFLEEQGIPQTEQDAWYLLEYLLNTDMPCITKRITVEGVNRNNHQQVSTAAMSFSGVAGDGMNHNNHQQASIAATSPSSITGDGMHCNNQQQASIAATESSSITGDGMYCDNHRVDRGWYLLHQSDSVPEELAARYGELLAVRGRHVPLQHITCEQEFMGLTFHVNKDVLIPRQDTELLVEEARKVIKPDSRVLDVCTGSGCILISLLKLCEKRVGEGNSPSDGGYGRPGGTLAEEQRDKIQAMACDLSEKALAVAKENAARLGVQIDFRQGDLFEPAEGVFGLIVSNPPYIPTEDIGGLMEEVRAHDPAMALDGGADGLDFYRRITREAPGYLKDGGWLMVEIGCEQAQKVSEMMREQGFIEISIVKDLAGLDRVVRAKKPEDGL